MPKKILVIPSIRGNSFKDFISAWEYLGDWDELILVEDNPNKTFKIDSQKPYHHFSWYEIQEELKDHTWIISRRDSAIRSFGFLKALELGADYILTLDDDCYPYDDRPIFDTHISKMNSVSRWTESVPFMRTRGLPYQNLGKINDVVANMGFWSRIPDLDSVQSLNNIDFATNGQFDPPKGNRLIPRGQYFPLCGMNYCFQARVVPLSYFPLMGCNSPYARFDDIWHGVIFKKVIDHLGWSVSVGEPFVAHQRASNIMTNLVKEAPGIRANESFWETVDSVSLSSYTPNECIAELGMELEKNDDVYVSKLGKALQIWSQEVSNRFIGV